MEPLFTWFGDSNGKRSSEVTGEIVTGCVMDSLLVLFAWEWLPGELLSVRVTVRDEEEEDNDEEFEVTEGIIDTEECGCESWTSDFAIAAVLLVGNKLTL